MTFRDTPIQRKLVLIILLTSVVALLLMRSAFFAFEYLTFRQATRAQGAALGKVIAASSSAALSFDDQKAAEEYLSGFGEKENLVAAAFYDSEGDLFARYPTNLSALALPEKLGKEDFQYVGSYLIGFEPVVEKNKRVGTLYVKFDTSATMRQWVRVSALIGLGVMTVVLALTYLISNKLQKHISQPILALAETARAVSARRDYSVRATKVSENELGLLTDAFNQMLTQIQEQNQALRESEARVRAVVNSALSAVVVIDAAGKITDWNARAERMFGWTHAEALGLVLAETIIPPRYREAHCRGMEHYRATGEGPVLNQSIELNALRRDGSEFPVELSISPMKAGGVMSFCGFITDITERKRQEEIRARFVAIVQSSDDAIISKTLDGIITSWNPGAEKLFGYTTDEVLGKSMSMLVPPDRAEEETEILALVARGENIAHFDTVRTSKDGNALDVSVSISPIKDNQGKAVGVSTIARDITERRRAEGRFRSVVESAPNAIVLVNQTGTITMVNAQTEKLFGYTRTELVGQSVENLVPERFRGRHPGYRAGFFADPSARAMGAGRELFGLRKDGQEVPVEIGLSPIETKEGMFVLASIIDITERKRAEAQLAMLAHAFESTTEPICITDIQDRFTFVNPAFQQIYGYAPSEILGKTPAILFSPRNPPSLLTEILEQTRRGGWRGEVMDRRKDGTEFPAFLSTSQVKDAAGQVIGLMGVAQDITELKKQEEVRSQFVAIVQSSDDAIIGMSLDDVVTSWNPGAEKLFGYTEAEILGQSMRVLIPPERADERAAILAGIKRGLSVNQLETTRIRKDGTTVEVSMTVSPVKDVHGKIVGCSGIVRDISERHRAQRVLRRSESQLRLVWENALDGMRLTDEEGVIRMVNEAYCRVIGKPREELEGHSMAVLYEAHREQEVLHLHRERFRAHIIPAHHETEVTLWNGRRVIFELSNAFLEIEGQTPLLFSTFRDITERKQAEEELRRQHHLLRTLIDQLPDYIYVKDREGRFVVANLAVAQIMGAATPERLLGKTDADFYPREEAAKYQADEAGVFLGEAIINKDEPHLDRSGQRWEMLTTKVPLRDSDGKIIGLIGIGRDITTSKQAEKREATFARLSQSLSAVATLDAAAHLIADTADELFGWDACTLDVYAEERDMVHPVINIDTVAGERVDVPPAYVGRPPTPLMRRVLELGAQLLLRPEPVSFTPEAIRFGDTSRPSASLMHVPIRRGSKILGILSIQSYTPKAYDEKALNTLQTLADQCAGAMERVRAEDDLRRLNEELEHRVRDRTAQLEAANKELEAFSYSVSHDLRAPLRHIDGFSEMLRKEAATCLSAPGQRYLGIISHSAKRMGTLIDDLLVFSRMGRAALRPTRVKMDALVAEVLREMGSDLQNRKIHWDIGRLPEVNVDRALFKQVWVNLLSNAVKYTRHRDEAVIKIRCRVNEAGEHEFSVQDNGAGFDMSFAGKLFGVFQRLHQAEEFEGTGIGLANVRRIVARHGGNTWGEGKVDTGATFNFTVPDPGRKKA